MSDTDSTSFASILAGVQRLRGDTNQQQQQPSDETNANANTTTNTTVQQDRPLSRSSTPSSIPSKRINAFNQDKTFLNDPSRNLINRSGKPSTISVNKSQTGNPLLKNLLNVNWSYTESRNPYDYLINNRFILFLSLKYHKLHPEYITIKMKPLLKKNAILLTVVDVENSETILKELNKICLYNEFTLLLAFNFDQAAKYLTYLATPARASPARPPSTS